MGALFGQLRRVLATQALRRGHRARRLPGRAATASWPRIWPRAPQPHGFTTKGDLIWYQAGTRLRPYGYPHAFVPNIVHQHILVLRAE